MIEGSVNQRNLEGEDGADSKSPGFSFLSCLNGSQSLYEKLTLLNYHKEFCSEFKCRPIHRYYFSFQSNPGEQFYTFSCLSIWLINSKLQRKGGDGYEGTTAGVTTTQVSNPQEYEDPNVTISSILDSVRSFSSGKKLPLSNLTPSKLKQGFGHEVICLLNLLTDLVLEKGGHHYRQEKNGSPSISVKGLVSADETEDDDEDEIASNQDNDCEINSEEQNYTLIDEETHEQENEPLSGAPFSSRLESSNQNHEKSESEGRTSDVTRPKQVLISSTDASLWMSEVDHVLPQLKLVLRSTGRKSDWRSHLSQLQTQADQMREQFVLTDSSLNRLTEEIKGNLERISSREKYIQNQFEPLISEHNSLRNHLNGLTENYRVVSSGVTEKSQLLSEISDELDAVKAEMEERGSSMTDGTPVISLRKALQRIKSELTTIDIRIGVATHTILQSNFSEATGGGSVTAGDPHILRHDDTNDGHLYRNTSSLQRLVF